jgi:hypothetical protein
MGNLLIFSKNKTCGCNAFRVLANLTQCCQVFLTYYNDSLVRDDTSDRIVSFGGVAKILGGLKPNYGNSAPKVMFYSARGPDPEDNSLTNADILKPNLIAPGSSIWGAWSSRGLDSAEFAGNSTKCSLYSLFFCSVNGT